MPLSPRSEAGKKVADRQIHILPPFSKDSCSTIRASSVQKNEPARTSKSPLGRTLIPADVQLGTALAPSYTRNAERIADARTFRCDPKMPVSAGQQEFTGQRA